MVAVDVMPALDPSLSDACGASTPDSEPEVDETLLDATLAMTVLERLQQNDRMIRTVFQLSAGFAALG
jgi:hypothetical protein